MPFGVVSGVGREMGVFIDVDGDRWARGSFGGKCGASHCNQWDSLCEGRRRSYSEITLGFLVILLHSQQLLIFVVEWIFFSDAKPSTTNIHKTTHLIEIQETVVYYNLLRATDTINLIRCVRTTLAAPQH